MQYVHFKKHKYNRDLHFTLHEICTIYDIITDIPLSR